MVMGYWIFIFTVVNGETFASDAIVVIDLLRTL